MDSLPRVAVTTGALRVPPTYFVLQHAALLRESFDFEVFARVADIRDDSLRVPVHDATPLGGAFRTRARASLAFGGRQANAVRRFAPAIVHQHFGTWSEPAISAAQRLGVPLLTTVHGYDVFTTITDNDAGNPHLGLRRRFGRWTRSRSTHAAFLHSSRILTVSRFLADRAIEGGADASKIAVHFQGVDTDFFTPTAARRSLAPPLVVFVGALSERKGPQDLLEASSSLASTHQHRLVFVGSGDLETELRARAADQPHVSFAGSLTREQVRALLRDAHVMVLPTQESNGWREAAGLVLLEAQACGTPVVTYRSGGAPEMLEDGVTGLVAPEKDVTELGEAIRSILAMPTVEHRRMSVAAREFVVRERSLTASARELDAHYRELIG